MWELANVSIPNTNHGSDYTNILQSLLEPVEPNNDDNHVNEAQVAHYGNEVDHELLEQLQCFDIDADRSLVTCQHFHQDRPGESRWQAM